MQFFTKPVTEIDQKSLPKSQLKRLKNVFDDRMNQNQSTAFSLFWFSLVKRNIKLWPRNKHYSVWNGYKDPNTFMIWYARRNHGRIIGARDGKYRELFDTKNPHDVSGCPQKPNCLIPRHILLLIRIHQNPPKFTNGRARVRLSTFDFKGKCDSQTFTFHHPSDIYPFVRGQIGEHLRLYRNVEDSRLINYLKEEFLLWQP